MKAYSYQVFFGLWFSGVDGIRVDTNGDVWAEVTDSKGEVTDLTFISNVQDIKDQ
jgi:secreted PhoX family phosphatase